MAFVDLISVHRPGHTSGPAPLLAAGVAAAETPILLWSGGLCWSCGNSPSKIAEVPRANSPDLSLVPRQVGNWRFIPLDPYTRPLRNSNRAADRSGTAPSSIGSVALLANDRPSRFCRFLQRSSCSRRSADWQGPVWVTP